MRYPAFAGSFYESDKAELKAQIDGYLKKADADLAAQNKSFKQVFGIVVPHAGHIYSGQVAAYAYSAIKEFPPWTTFVIVGPNHTGRGKVVAISRDDWKTPLGVVKNDRELGDAIKRNSSISEFDEEAHEFEHSIEVQMPFLQTLFGDVRAVEICMGIQDYNTALDLGTAIHQAAKETNRPVIVVASSDFTHFESAEYAKRNDELAIKLIERLKAREFVDLVRDENISICGYAPIATAIVFAEKREAKAGSLLRYANSGDVTGDYGNVVGYASIVLWK
ncbi:MAG: MEMO1 family protein [Candidatus Micrarchaeia archaeon]